jgi:flagellar assembly protein FliH
LQADEVRPYNAAGETPNGDGVVDMAESTSERSIELESLDLVKLGPYLLMLRALEDAEGLVDRARQESDKILEEARLEGVAKGLQEAKQEALPAAVAFANAGQALIVFEEQMITRYAPEMVRLALEIAEKIVHRTVLAVPEIIGCVLERASQEVTDARQIRIRLNPADYELLAEMRPDLLRLGNDGGRTIEVVADQDLTRGGCRLETEIGIVDATVPTQIAEIRRHLLDQESPASHADSVPSTTRSAGMSREL